MTLAADMSFWTLQRRAAGLYSASAFYGFTNGALFPLIAISLAQSGVSELRIGWIASAYYVGAFVAALTFAPVVRLIGYRYAMLLIAIVGAGSTAAAILPLPLAGWLAVRGLFGYAAAGVYIVIDSWLGNLSGLANRGRMLGINEGLRTALASAGQFLVALANTSSGILIAAGSMLLAGLPVLATPEPHLRAQSHARQRNGLSIALKNWPVFLIILLSGLTISVLYAMPALYARQIGLTPAETAIYLVTAMVVGAASQNLAGALTDLFGRAIVLAAMTALGFIAAACLALGLISGAWAITAVGAVVAAATFPIYSLALTRMIDLAQPSEVVSATSISLIGYTSGASFGPALSGLAMAQFGTIGFYGFLAIALWLTSAIALGEAFRRPKP
ncbi:MAG: MFS transporter [Hyphomicrobiaceae bacterium]